MGSTLSSRAKGTQKTKEPVGARGHTALKAEPKPTATWDLHHTTNDEAIEPSSTFDTESEDDDADGKFPLLLNCMICALVIFMISNVLTSVFNCPWMLANDT